MTDQDPSPQDILAAMVSDAGDDQEGEWRVSIPTRQPPPWLPAGMRNPPTFAEAVVVARAGLDAAGIANPQGKEAPALSGLLTAALVRHENQQCGCGPRYGTDPICQSAQELATAIAGF